MHFTVTLAGLKNIVCLCIEDFVKPRSHCSINGPELQNIRLTTAFNKMARMTNNSSFQKYPLPDDHTVRPMYDLYDLCTT